MYSQKHTPDCVFGGGVLFAASNCNIICNIMTH